jgi:hypothetical protein
MAKFGSIFDYAEQVTIDGDHSLKAVVTGFHFGPPGYEMIDVAWIHNGEQKTATVHACRLKSTLNKPLPPGYLKP